MTKPEIAFELLDILLNLSGVIEFIILKFVLSELPSPRPNLAE
jgi:hypothetical protein